MPHSCAGGDSLLEPFPCGERGGSSCDVSGTHSVYSSPALCAAACGQGQVPFRATGLVFRDPAQMADAGSTRTRITLHVSLVPSAAPAVGALPC